MILQIPADAKTYELQNSILWFDQEGIAYSVPANKNYVVRTRESAENEIKRVKEIAGGRKLLMIMETHSDTQPISKKDREVVSEQINELFTALAIISNSRFHTLIVRLLFSFKPPKFPQNIFTSERDAKEWIRQYL